MEIPARIVWHCASIKAEVVSKDIPLLLSKKAMEAAKVNKYFVNSKIEIFGSDLDIIFSTSGHYCIPIFSFEHTDYENKRKVLVSLNDTHSKVEKHKVVIVVVVTQAVWAPHVSKTYRTTKKCWD